MLESPRISSLQVSHSVVGIGECAAANQPYIAISTYALGSCVGVVAYDAVVGTGGLLHIMLPDSVLSPSQAKQHPGMFADTGVPLLFQRMAELGGLPERMKIFLAGGASMLAGPDSFRIGERNVVAVREVLQRCGGNVVGAETGGTLNRSLHLEIEHGRLTVRLPESSIEVFLT